MRPDPNQSMNSKTRISAVAWLGLVLGAGAATASPLGGSLAQWGAYQIPSVSAGTRVAAIASGYESAFAITDARAAMGWGGNGYCETATPEGLSNVVAVSLDTHTVALKSDGTVGAWGDNSDGATNVPAGLSNVVMISAECGHTVALKCDGTVVAWGDNFCGESDVPAGLSNAVAVAAGCCSSFILRADGSVICLTQHTNALVFGVTNAVAIAPNYGNLSGGAWIVQSDGTVIYTRLSGDAVFTNNVVPGLSNIVALSGGDRAGGVLALQADGTASYLAGDIQPCASGATAVAINGGGAYALLTNGSVVQFGPNLVQQQPIWVKTRRLIATTDTMGLTPEGGLVPWAGNPDYNTTAGLGNVTAISEGYGHCLALKSDSTVFAWGDDSDGQCNVPAGLSNVVAIAAGGYHSLALKSDGTVVGWGYNAYGQAYGGGLSGVAAISAGALHSLVLMSNGTVRAWGYNAQGQLNLPYGLTNVMAIAAGGAHNLVLKTDGTVVAWGYDQKGQTDVPAGLSNVVAVAAGGDHSLVLKSDSTVVAWGSNDYGESTVPSSLGPAVAVSAGPNDSMALVLPPVPVLQAQVSEGSLVASWPTNYTGFTLQSSPGLYPANWSPCPNPPVVVDHQYFVTNPVTADSLFFRLKK
jgi:alpha-tubulin suppressor-like RCC1 family protein